MQMKATPPIPWALPLLFLAVLLLPGIITVLSPYQKVSPLEKRVLAPPPR